MISFDKSASLFTQAQRSIPGGVNSPVRAFKNVGGTPVFIQKAKGAYLFDEDGNKYIDYIGSWGPMLLGHAYAPVIKAIQDKANDSTSFGAPTALETDIAELIKSMVPGIDMVRMVNSGTEACMSAIRLARGYTGKNKFIKFEGCYHGHADCFLVKAGSGVATFNIQNVPGVTQGAAQDTLTCHYNDLEGVKQLIAENKNEIAAIIVEPVGGNMGCVPPKKDFLQSLRQICTEENMLLIFDEVMTGFRLAPGGAQQLFDVQADIVTFGKIIGAGMPVGAFAGRKEIMSHIAPLGNVYQAGTLSGNPLAMVAGYTLLKELANNAGIYKELEEKGAYLQKGLETVFTESKIPFKINRIGSMISMFFTDKIIYNFDDVQTCNFEIFSQFFHKMLSKGIYLPPSQYESWFLSNALSFEDLDNTILACKETLREIA